MINECNWTLELIAESEQEACTKFSRFKKKKGGRWLASDYWICYELIVKFLSNRFFVNSQQALLLAKKGYLLGGAVMMAYGRWCVYISGSRLIVVLQIYTSSNTLLSQITSSARGRFL